VAATDEGWSHPPFSAELTGAGAERVLWGRGTLDDKGSVAALLEAAERMLAAGPGADGTPFRPRHDVYLLFGHDEETAGTGAAAASALLRERGVRIGLVLDEGGAVVRNVFPTVTRPVAVVGVSEKGITTFTLTVHQQGGHASTPPKTTASDRLARAIVRLHRHPFPGRMNAPTLALIRTVGAHGRQPLRFVFTRARLFQPLLRVLFGRLGPETAAMVRTTTAVTRLNGGLAANALPERAQAVLNVRIAIGSSVAATRRRLQRVIDDPQVEIGVIDANEPAPVSRMEGPAWELLRASIETHYPEAIVTPYVQTGATDSRHFTRISEHVYRFAPFRMDAAQRRAIHSYDEHLGVDAFLAGIAWYEALLAELPE
jgi:carboxypeptidase PM20D1